MNIWQKITFIIAHIFLVLSVIMFDLDAIASATYAILVGIFFAVLTVANGGEK